MTFQVGDNVVYPSQGAGVVEEMTTREVLGETQQYLKIVFVRGDMEVLVPLRKGQEVGLRHTVGRDEIDQVYEALAKADLSLPTQWPPRYRAEQDILAGGSAYDLARLIGVLSKRDIEKGLAATEREVLESAKSMLTSELAVVQQLSLDEASAQLEAFVAERIT
ncbi:MAG: CarD family transcriptional regulator [Deinococcales bacterium]